ncbi:MAG: methyl-accepting chemotaxis protein [Schwartzia sp.]|nr:methyl-accepting chemotaxis protein [Schwartzia sp. (in: firmicutes)]
MLTSSAPITRDGKPVGVVTVDIGMKELEDYIQNIKIGETGYAFLLTQTGQFVASKNADQNLKVKIQDSPDAKVAAFGKGLEAQKAEAALYSTDAFGTESYVMVTPIGDSHLRLVLVAPKADYMGPIHNAIKVSVGLSVVVVLVLCTALWLIFQRRIGAPIAELIKDSQRIAGGDLTTEIVIENEDEIGQLAGAMLKMKEGILGVIIKISESAQQMAASSEELTASSAQTAQTAMQVAQSVVTASDAVEKQQGSVAISASNIGTVSATLEEIQAESHEASNNAQNVSEAAKHGGEAVVDAVQQIRSVESTVEDSAAIVDKLGERSKEIGQIVDSISAIASQTNLLALNAAIEAARAGEAGRGFAVVAEEVRKLAEQSGEAAQNISSLIMGIQTDTDSAVSAMKDGREKVTTGAKAVEGLSDTFDNIIKDVMRIATEITNIAESVRSVSESSQSIAAGIAEVDQQGQQVSDEMQSVSSATEEQSASAQEIASASDSLAHLAQELQETLARFKF